MKIKSFKYSLIFFFLIHSIGLSQYEFELTGYVFELPVYQRLGDSIDSLMPGNTENKNLYQNITKIRLRPVFTLWDDARIEAAFETRIDISKYANPIFSSNNIYPRHLLRMDWNIYDKGDISITESIDRLFYKQTFENFEMTLGRQRINWGVGRIWQPTEMFHPVNPANFGKIEKTGADALSMKYFFGNFTDAEVIVNFRERIRDYNYGMRVRTNFSPFDMSGIIGYFDRNPVVGFDFTGNLFDAGVRAEAVYVRRHDAPDSSYVRFIAGVDRQLTPEVYAMLEFLYNGEGELCKYCYQPQKLLMGNTINLGVYYISAMASWLAYPLVTVTGVWMQNINDYSGYFAPSVAYSALENLSLTVAGMIPYGLQKSEFWYYPISAYFIAQYFF